MIIFVCTAVAFAQIPQWQNLFEAYALKAHDVRSNMEFGIAVGASKTFVAVGAPAHRSCETGVRTGAQALAEEAAGARNFTCGDQGDYDSLGAVYVYRADGANSYTLWNFIKPPVRSQTYHGVYFGAALAMADNVLAVAYGDRTCDLLSVSAPTYNPNDGSCPHSGGVLVYTPDLAQQWTPRVRLRAFDGSQGDGALFGFESSFDRTLDVSASGRFIVVGATRESSCATGINDYDNGHTICGSATSGAAYVYWRPTNDASDVSWQLVAFLKPPAADTEHGMFYGASVAVVELTEADDAAIEAVVVVGAPYTSPNGKAYVYTLPRSTNHTAWQLSATLTASSALLGTNPLYRPLAGLRVDVGMQGDRVVVAASAPASSQCGLNVNNVTTSSCNNRGIALLYYAAPSDAAQWPSPSAPTTTLAARLLIVAFGYPRLASHAVLAASPYERDCAQGIDTPYVGGCNDAGVVYVHMDEPGNGSLSTAATRYVKSSSLMRQFDRFGQALDVDRTGNRFIAGAPFDNNCDAHMAPATGSELCLESGAAYVFVAPYPPTPAPSPAPVTSSAALSTTTSTPPGGGSSSPPPPPPPTLDTGGGGSRRGGGGDGGGVDWLVIGVVGGVSCALLTVLMQLPFLARRRRRRQAAVVHTGSRRSASYASRARSQRSNDNESFAGSRRASAAQAYGKLSLSPTTHTELYAPARRGSSASYAPARPMSSSYGSLYMAPGGGETSAAYINPAATQAAGYYMNNASETGGAVYAAPEAQARAYAYSGGTGVYAEAPKVVPPQATSAPPYASAHVYDPSPPGPPTHHYSSAGSVEQQ